MYFPEDDVYITGVSGAFPESKSVYELQKSLFNKVDLITSDDRRWKQQSDAPQRTGKILDVEKFDASFFDVQFKRAHVMDPVARILHEKVYEAIVDAGYNPSELRKFKVGIYFGYNLSESEQSSVYLKQNLHEYGLTSCSRALLTNNIFQWLGVSGPSYSVDTACSSAAYAIEHAFKAIKEGRCDMALVGGANTCLIPHVSVNFNRLGVLSQDGKCKCFDNKANGYCRSETVGVVFLQKAKYSRRVYASVVHAKANCDGFKEQGITFPASSVQKEVFQSFYRECGIAPNDIEYIEAHGTGHRGTIICVDGGPEFLNNLAKSAVTGENYNNLESVQRAVLKRFFNICAPKKNQDVTIQDVFKHISFEERIHALVNMAPGSLQYSKKFLANMIAALYHRLILVINNENELKKLDKKLKSKIILIRTRSLPPFLECSDDYGLGIYGEGDVTVHRLNEDHKTIIECDECANIVNNIVSKE